MYLSGETFKNTIAKYVEDYQEDHIDQVSYDLCVKDILDPNTKESNSTFELKPGETVFISSQEIVTIPNDCVGVIHLRNSVIRMGLFYESPIYQPGHRTRIFTRIKNESSNAISIDSGESIVSLMFDSLGQSVSPYQGKYNDQLEFSKVNKFDSTKPPEIIRLKKTEKNIKDIEKPIYTNVMTIMTVFIAVLSIINLNISLLNNRLPLKYVITYNLVIISGISALITLVSLVLKSINDRAVKLALLFTVFTFLMVVLSYLFL